MAEYIDKQAALDALSAHKEVLLYIMDKCGVTEEVNKTLEIICNVPPADAIEVVRCKDCKYQDKGENESESWNVCNYRPWLYFSINDDDFCSYGERKDG